MDTWVMAGHFISFHHRGLQWNWPNTGLLCPSAASDLVKQGDDILNEITSDGSDLQVWLRTFMYG